MDSRDHELEDTAVVKEKARAVERNVYGYNAESKKVQKTELRQIGMRGLLRAQMRIMKKKRETIKSTRI